MGSLTKTFGMGRGYNIGLALMALTLQVVSSCIPINQPPNSPPTDPPSEAPSEAATNAPTAAANNSKQTTLPAFDDCVTVEGMPCKFPFTYQYHQHNQCLPFKGKHWCALTALYDKSEWGYCDMKLCPGEEPEPEATTNTTTGEGILTWVSSETTVE